MAEKAKEGQDNKVIQVVPKEEVIDISKTVKVKTTDKAPYHKADLEIDVAPAVAEKMKANGWAI